MQDPLYMYNIPFQNLCYRKSIKHINYICVSMFYRLINYRCTNSPYTCTNEAVCELYVTIQCWL